MDEEIRPGDIRESELLQVLASYAETPAVGYRFVVGFVVFGLLASVALAVSFARAPRREPFRLQGSPSDSFRRGVAAYEQGDWDEALAALRDAQGEAWPPSPRLHDYLNRLALVRRDGERLTRAEEALAADEPELALLQAASIPPNSPLYAQAEVLSRHAHAQLQQSEDVRAVPPPAPPSARSSPLAPPSVRSDDPAPRVIEPSSRPRSRAPAPTRRAAPDRAAGASEGAW